MKKISIVLIFVIFVSQSNCISTNAGITTSNIPIYPDAQDIRYITTDTIAKSWYSFDIGILGFPLKEPPIDDAIQELLKKHNGNALINIRYYTQKSIFIFITKNTFVLKADIVNIIPKNIENTDTKKRK